MKSFICILIVFFSFKITQLNAQNYIDTAFAIQTDFDVNFDTIVDFAGQSSIQAMDISYPTNDSPPTCGRPLLVVVHGGAWIAGDKSENNVSRIRTDFAKRGYTTASVNYRLGQFHSSTPQNCNIQIFGLEWNCLNMGDTSEWYRAYYRGIQDVNSAIRYLVNHASSYQIDVNQIFIVGESAGGFIAMGVAFIDNMNEVSQVQTGAKIDIAAPHSMYESACIQGYGIAPSIATMDLSRPALGNYDVGGNPLGQNTFRIIGVGNIFGGVFNDIFTTSSGTPPSLYLFHQPNDLIVPFNSGKVFKDYNNCLQNAPFNCGNIVNRPVIYGSNSIKQMIDNLATQGQTVPDYVTDFTSNTSPCSVQPGQGHAYDNFWLRTANMASYFATKIGPCTMGFEQGINDFPFHMFPNPIANDQVKIQGDFSSVQKVKLLNMNGSVMQEINTFEKNQLLIQTSNLTKGVYLVQIISENKTYRSKLVKQ
ncbi:MAG: T9SS type A sorting domain-containing protein [Putridiphycobacter sp.]|nr:T9SS type A sorting domain-containing protein [Putridiphycobacter sp.]